MADTTDPALDLADLCDRLNVGVNTRGDAFLGEQFAVQPWSPEFYQIVSSIVNRIAELRQIIGGLLINPAVIGGAQKHLGQIGQAFGFQSFSSHWNAFGRARVSPENSSPVRMLSPALPPYYSYPKLTEIEALELEQTVDQLLAWLRDAQLNERDFIRASLIEGLEAFLFRLQRLAWFGWGHSVESLREVILAYLTLERGTDLEANPDAGALLKKTGAVLRKVYGYAAASKDAAETGDWLLGLSRAALRVATGPAGGAIAGYLTS